LPFVLLGLRAAPKEEANVSSAECTYGVPLALPGGASLPLPEESSATVIPSTTRRTYAEVAAGPPVALRGVEMVFVKKGPPGEPLTAAYAGPYRVVELGAKAALVEVGGKTDWISVDRLKPHLGTAPEAPARPPARGFPKKTESTSVG